MTDRTFKVGDSVEKFTGDYQLAGEVRAAFVTRAGKVRYVVEHDCGILHIYSAANLRPLRSWLQGLADRASGMIWRCFRNR